jgi:hypothetical protein
MLDRNLLYATAFLRALATGMIAVLLGIYLPQRGLDAAEVGFVITAGLAGAAATRADWAADRPAALSHHRRLAHRGRRGGGRAGTVPRSALARRVRRDGQRHGTRPWRVGRDRAIGLARHDG